MSHSEPERSDDRKSQLQRWWWQGVDAVRGEAAVERALRSLEQPPDAASGAAEGTPSSFSPALILAVGKAAAGMALGARSVLGERAEMLVATKHGHVDDRLHRDATLQVFECGHPIPDAGSIEAGEALWAAVRALSDDADLLLLVSGGASAICEVLKPGVSLDELIALNRRLMAGGDDIVAINRQRLALSESKAGGLLSGFGGRHVEVLGISDVPDARFATLGSGIGDCSRIDTGPSARSWCQRIIGSNHIARERVQAAVEADGLNVISNSETLYDDVERVAEACARELENGPDGVYIWGGEPTVVLPENPGEGGRNQALALLLARHMSGRDDLDAIVAGTDGSDGPTDAAGAIVDGGTWQRGREPDRALNEADSGCYLESIGQRFHTGPTGTNVMDLLIARKGR